MVRIENQMVGLTGVASRFSVLQDDDSMGPANNTRSKKASVSNKGSKKKSTGMKVDLKEAAFKTSTKTKTKKTSSKPQKKRSDVQSQSQLDKLNSMFSRATLNSEDSDGDSSSDDPQYSKDLNGNLKNAFSMKHVTFSPNKTVFDSSHGSDSSLNAKSIPEKSTIKTKKTENIKKGVLHDDKNLKLKTIEHSNVLQNQYKVDLDKKDNEILHLKASNEDLKKELDRIKKRYQTTRSILDEVEMKEKAELVKELIKERGLKDELSQNVIDLTKELEKYRTKEKGLEKKELRSKNDLERTKQRTFDRTSKSSG